LLIGIVCLLLQAAAAMCVGMGSFSDPFEAQGLAHFLGLIIYHLSTDKLVLLSRFIFFWHRKKQR
jgi:hypothetical protein